MENESGDEKDNNRQFTIYETGNEQRLLSQPKHHHLD